MAAARESAKDEVPALPLPLQGERVGVRGSIRAPLRNSLWRRPLIPTSSP